MRKTKQLSIILLIATLFVLFLPTLLTDIRNNECLDTKTNFIHEPSNFNQLSRQEFASYFATQFNSSATEYFQSEKEDEEDIRHRLIKAMETFLYSDDPSKKEILSVLDGKIIDITQFYSLSIYNQQPHTFSYTQVTIENDNIGLFICFEENTSTIVYLELCFAYQEEIETYLNFATTHYYENHLKLNPYQYYIQPLNEEGKLSYSCGITH